jgi:hypothetical protein
LIVYRQTTLVLLIGLIGLLGSILSYTYAEEQYTLVRKWGSAGVDNGQFDRPENLGLSSTNVFVADTDNHRIQKFDIHGSFITTWGVGLLAIYQQTNISSF